MCWWLYRRTWVPQRSPLALRLLHENTRLRLCSTLHCPLPCPLWTTTVVPSCCHPSRWVAPLSSAEGVATPSSSSRCSPAPEHLRHQPPPPLWGACRHQPYSAIPWTRQQYYKPLRLTPVLSEPQVAAGNHLSALPSTPSPPPCTSPLPASSGEHLPLQHPKSGSPSFELASQPQLHRPPASRNHRCATGVPKGNFPPASSARGLKGWLGLAAFVDKAHCNSRFLEFPFGLFQIQFKSTSNFWNS
jgi:hypothetical protein